MPVLEKVTYKGWPNCLRYASDSIELIITTDVGPRIISMRVNGGENMFANFEDMVGKMGGDAWRIYGGHRFWHAPEDPKRTYFPDNNPITVEEHDSYIRLIQPTEPTTSLEKQIDITFVDDTQLKVTHRLVNHSMWAVEASPWALSVMDQSGTAIVPLPPRGSHRYNLLPTNTMTLWAYTDMTDPRWTWGEKYILLRQDPTATKPQKAGMNVPSGWAAYAGHGSLFLKTFAYDADATYPDIGCNVETFTNNAMLELETLGPIAKIAPGETAVHIENWYLFDGVVQPANDADVDATILPLVKQVTG